MARMNNVEFGPPPIANIPDQAKHPAVGHGISYINRKASKRAARRLLIAVNIVIWTPLIWSFFA